MNNYIKLLIAVVIIIIGLYFYFQKEALPPNTNNQPPVVTNVSIAGCYVAHLAKDIYTLSIQSDNNKDVSGILAYNNFQKDSSSGSFKGTYKDGILIGTYSFQSEGMDSVRQVIFKKVGDSFIQGFGQVVMVDGKEIFDPLSSVDFDSKSIFVKSNSCLEKFTDINNIFSYEYNPIFKNIPGNSIPTVDWKFGSAEQGILLASVIIPKTFMPGTNFSDAKLTIGRATSPQAINSCLNNKTNGEMKSEAVKISNYSFTKFTQNTAAAGNLYETTSYRGIVDGDCYAIEYTIHSTNIGNYGPEQKIQEFNKNVIEENLEMIIKSIKFLINSD